MTDTRPTPPARIPPKEIPSTPAKDAPAAARDGLALLLGPRQADIMRLIWTYGPATVRKLHEDLKREHALAYNTVMTLCVRLCHKGLPERRRIQAEDGQAQIGHPYIYAPRISEDDFVRAAVDAQLQALIAHFPALIGASAAATIRLRQPGATGRASIEQLLAYLGSLQDADGRFADNAELDTIARCLSGRKQPSAEQGRGRPRRGMPSGGCGRPRRV